MSEFVIKGPNGEEYRITPPDNVSAEEAESTLGGAISQLASGVSRGALGTLDIPAQAIGAVGNIAGWLTTGESPEFQPRPFRNIGRWLGLGVREPQTGLERGTGFAGEMIGATALPAGLATRAAALPTSLAVPAGAPELARRTLGVEAASLGGAIGGGLVGEQLGGLTGQLVGTVAGGMAPAAAPWAAGALIAPRRQAQMRENLAAAERLGVDITAGQAAGGSFIEKGSSMLPGAQYLAQEFAEAQAKQMGQRVRELIPRRVREASPEAAGRAVRRGLEEFRDEFKARGNQLYESVHALIPPQTPTSLRRTRDQLEKLVMDEEFSEILDAPLVRRLNKAFENKESVPYEIAHAIRSRVGDRLSGSELIADAPKGQLKALYAALSDDLDDVAAAIGPQAERAAKRSSDYWRSGLKRIDDFLNPIQRSKAPEKVYAAATAGTKEGASRIRTLKKSLNPEQWDVVVGTVIKRLGRTVPSARTAGELLEETTDFSPQTFLTNLEGLDPAARKVLFSGSRYEALELGMQDAQRVAQAIRSQQLTAFNPSGTGAAWYNTAGMALPTLGLMTSVPVVRDIGLGLGANYALRKGLQTPGVVNWLARPTAFQPSIGSQFARPYEYLQP